MKVQELRQLLGTADRECLEKAFVEIYKKLPKVKKEEMDSLVADILAGKAPEGKTPVGTGQKKVSVDFLELEQEIRQFLENAYAQNYFAPNRVIPKSQRPKWRFLVKNFIKELDKIPREDENAGKAAKLLLDLYRMLCTACCYYLFSTDDAFRSIGWEQQDLFQMVVQKVLEAGYTRESVRELLLCATGGGLSMEFLQIQQEMVLLGELRTSDMKRLAMEEAKKLVEDKNTKLEKAGKSGNGRYELEEAIAELSGMILLLSVELEQAEQGIVYFFKNYKAYNKEAVLYQALRYMDWAGEDELWIQVYEYGVKKKIKPGEKLEGEYKERLAERDGQEERE